MNEAVLGGWYDAGDHVKFGLPMAFSASMLGWAIYEYGDAIQAAGQLDDLERNLRFVQNNLNYWTVGTQQGERISYTPGGLAWLDHWGCLRYANSAAFCAFIFADMISDSSLKTRYRSFAERQVNYALGDNPQSSSYICGYGENPPIRPHHRTSHGSWCDQQTTPP